MANNLRMLRSSVIAGVLLSVFTLGMNTYAAEFGPGTRKEVNKVERTLSPVTYAETYDGPKLDIVIPILDPGIPDDQAKWEAQGIWPELRRAESVWYARQIAEAIEQTGIFNSVLVVADTAVSSDLYLLGKIKKSNGEDLEIDFGLYDTTGKKLIKTFKLKSRVEPDWYINTLRTSSDPFAYEYPVVAKRVVDQLLKINRKDKKRRTRNEKLISRGKFKQVKPEYLANVRMVRRAQYAKVLSEEEFGDVLSVRNNVTKLSYIPDMDQDNWQRVSSIIAADMKFNQLMDKSYVEMTTGMGDSYRIWHKDAYSIAKAQREAKAAANAAVVGAIFSIALAGTLASNSGSTAGQVAAASAAVVGAAALVKSFEDRAESKEHAAQLNELGNSVSSAMAPKVLAMEDREVELIGSASEQQAQWSGLLRELYAEGMQDFSDLEIVSTSSLLE
jgi:hypothetical protein